MCRFNLIWSFMLPEFFFWENKMNCLGMRRSCLLQKFAGFAVDWALPLHDAFRLFLE